MRVHSTHPFHPTSEPHPRRRAPRTAGTACALTLALAFGLPIGVATGAANGAAIGAAIGAATPADAIDGDAPMPGTVTLLGDVEAPVRDAFEKALGALPEAWRTIHPEWRLRRAAAADDDVDAPLADRIVARSTLARSVAHPPTITVFDAALTGRPRWNADAPDRDSLGVMLDQLAPTLGIERGVRRDGDPDGGWDPAWLEQAWCAFALRTRRLDPEQRDHAAPCPPIGDPATFDLLLEHGVRVAWGGLAPDAPDALVWILVHELAHLVQFGCCPREHLQRWSELSGWRHGPVHDALDAERVASAIDDPTGITRESPIVLIRLVLGDRRRGVEYSAGCIGCFPTLQARLDPMEDFAEAVRLMAHDPERLATNAPEKFLFVNAVGLNRTMSHVTPGPLWRSVQEIREARWGHRVIDALAGLAHGTEPTSDGPRIGAATITAIVRAHAELLDADAVAPTAFPEKPDDIPASVFVGADEGDLAVRIGDRTVLPPTAAIKHLWTTRLLERDARLRRDAQLLLELGDETAALEALDHLGTLADPFDRAERFVALYPALRLHLGRDAAEEAAAAEAAMLTELGRPWLTSWVRETAGLPVAPIPRWMLPTRLEAPDFLARRVSEAQRRLRTGDVDATLRTVLGMSSTPLGRWRRIEMLIAIVITLDASPADDAGDAGRRADRLLDAAAEIAEQIDWPLLRTNAKRLIARTERSRTRQAP